MTQRKIGERQEARPARSSDRTERRRAEERAQLYAGIIKRMQVGLNVWHLEDPNDLGSFRLVLSNPAAAQFTGVPREDVVGKTLAESYPAVLLTETPRVLAKVIRSGKARHLGEVRYGDERIPEAVFSLTAFPLPNNCVGVAFENITERKRADEALRETEEKFRKLTESEAASIFIYRGTKPLYANAAMETLTGYTREEILAGELWQAVHPDFQGLVRERSRARQQGEQAPSRYQLKILRKSGEERWADFTAGMIEFEGQPAVIGTAYDITERKRAEEALRESEERFRAIVENAPFGYYRVGKDGLWQYVNPVWERMHGYSLNDVIGKPFEITQTREDVDNARQVVKQALAGETITGEFSRSTRQGTIEYHSFNTQPVRQGNEIVAIEGFINDITERKRAEEALRESEARFRKLSDATFEGIAIHRKGTILDVNQALATMFGYEPSDVIDMHALDLTAPEFRDSFSQRVASGYHKPFETVGLRRDGSTFPCEIWCKPMPWHGQTVTVAALRDITERKRAEEALRTSEATYRSIFNATNDSIVVHDMETGEIVDANAAFQDRHGCTTEEARQLNVVPLGSGEAPYAQEDALRWIHKAAKEGPQRFEWLAKDRDGRDIWLDITLKRATIAGQDRVLAISRDITERKRAEEALRESEQRYRLLAENLTDVIWTADMDLNYTYISPSRQLLGQDPGRPMPQRVEEALTPASFEIVMKAFAEELAIENMDKEDLSRSRTLELENYRSDGSTVWVEDRMTFLRDRDGRPVGILGVTRDITERKQAEEALRESERRFRTLSEESFEGIAIHRKGAMLEANQALATMFGYELSEVIGMHALDFVAAESRDAVLQSILSKSREPFEFTGLRKDGTTFPVEVCGRPIPYQGKMVTVAALRDITDRKQKEEALQEAREELEARVERQMERGNPYGLTFRELTVLHLVAAGKADKEIASQLGITTLTASKHLANILSKMSAASRTEACVRALREGLLD